MLFFLKSYTFCRFRLGSRLIKSVFFRFSLMFRSSSVPLSGSASMRTLRFRSNLLDTLLCVTLSSKALFRIVKASKLVLFSEQTRLTLRLHYRLQLLQIEFPPPETVSSGITLPAFKLSTLSNKKLRIISNMHSWILSLIRL
ncbi:hypothetical protein ABID22_004078 [Pontibacter aydingkolensis]